MESCILYTIKRMLGVPTEDGPFDMEIVVGINSAIMVLNQLGIGPQGFMVKGIEETWSDLLDDFTDLEAVKSYIYIRTRLVFDPPTNSFLVNALQEQMKEYEWRLSIRKEERGIDDERPARSRTSWHKRYEMGRS